MYHFVLEIILEGPIKNETDYYIRFAYSGINENDINEGMAKLKKYFES